MRRPYPSYRDSGVEWLGGIPEHWDLFQLARIGSFFKGGGGTKEDEIEGGLPCVRYGDLYTQHQFLVRSTRARIAEETTGNYRELRYGDVLFAGSGETIEEIGKSAANLIEGRAYCGGDVIIFRPAVAVDAAYLGYASDCHPSVYQKACMGRGVTVMHIYSNELKGLLIPLPPLEEQRAIAAFIDRETGKIDQLVSQKRLLIERLDEYRQALTTRTVTRGLPPDTARAAGLDPSSQLKPSGVEWLGEIPEHWEVAQVRRWFAIVNGGTPASGEEDYWDGETVWLTPDDLGRNSASWISNGRRSITDDGVRNSSAHICPEGSIIMSTRAPIGHLAIAAAPVTTNQGCRTLIPDDATDSSFAYYSFVASRRVLRSLGQGTTFMELPSTSLGNLPMAHPPLDEQRAIAVFLDERLERIDELVSSVEVAIERLEEYRAALIAAAVTGKIDVRDAVPVTAERVGA